MENIPVMFVKSSSGPQGSKEAFNKLESKFPSLKGRKFYGTMLGGEYRACVKLEEGDDPEALGLQSWTIPGGEYVRYKLKDWSSKLDQIASTFEKMASEQSRDSTRPCIEFYRSQKELMLMLPIQSKN